MINSLKLMFHNWKRHSQDYARVSEAIKKLEKERTEIDIKIKDFEAKIKEESKITGTTNHKFYQYEGRVYQVTIYGVYLIDVVDVDNVNEFEEEKQ